MDIFDMLVNDLRSGATRLNRLLWSALLFAVAGHFFVVEPYFRLKVQERDEAREAAVVAARFSELDKEAKQQELLVTTATQTLERVKKRISGFPMELSARLPEIQQAITNPQPPPQLQRREVVHIGGFEFPQGMKDFDEAVRWYVRQWFERVVHDVEFDIIGSLSKMGTDPDAFYLKETGAMALDKLEAYMDRKEEEDPTFWKSYETGKVAFADDLLAIVNTYFQPIAEHAPELLNKTQARLAERKQEVDRLEAKRAVIERRRKQLDDRLKTLESPLGQLPLGTTDLIVAFPVLLAGVVLMLTIALRRMRLLRAAIDREQLIGEKRMNAELLDLCAGCSLLPPYRKVTRLLVVVGAFLVLLSSAVRAAWLVASEAGKAMLDREDLLVFSRQWILVVYVVACAVVLVCLCSLWQTLSRKPLHTNGGDRE